MKKGATIKTSDILNVGEHEIQSNNLFQFCHCQTPLLSCPVKFGIRYCFKQLNVNVSQEIKTVVMSVHVLKIGIV